MPVIRAGAPLCCCTCLRFGSWGLRRAGFMTSDTAFPLSYELLEASGMAEPSRQHLVQLLLFVFHNRYRPCAPTCLACPTCPLTAWLRNHLSLIGTACISSGPTSTCNMRRACALEYAGSKCTSKCTAGPNAAAVAGTGTGHYSRRGKRVRMFQACSLRKLWPP